MSLFNNNSLRNLIKDQIAAKHPELKPSVNRSWFDLSVDYLNRRDKAWIVPLIVIACFALFAFSPLPGLMSRCPFFALVSFEDIKSAATLIDQRTSNIATIISMTLAVTAILLSNMAIKETLVYDLLYKRSKLNLIIFYTLSVIGCLILVGTSKDSYPKEKIQFFYNGVLTGTYLVLVILVMIGHLFKVVYEFSSSTAVKKMLSVGLLDESKDHLKNELFQRAAQEHFSDLMTKAGYASFDYRKANQGGVPVDKLKKYSKLKDGVIKYIHNIDLKKLSIALKDKAKPDKGFFRELTLDSGIDNYSYLLLINDDQVDSKQKNEALTGSLELKDVKDLPAVKKDFQKYFDQKLKDAIAGKKQSEVAEIMGYYREIQMNSLKHKTRK